MDAIQMTSVVFYLFLRCQILLEPLWICSVKKHEWSKCCCVKKTSTFSNGQLKKSEKETSE